MAAHIKTYLEQILAEKDLSANRPGLYQHALSYAQVGDQFDGNEWVDLNEAESWEEFQAIAKEILPKYTEIWVSLGEPRHIEAWKAEEHVRRLITAAIDVVECWNDSGYLATAVENLGTWVSIVKHEKGLQP